MRLRGQLLLSTLGAALLSAAIGVFLLGRQSEERGRSLLDGEVRIGEQMLLQKWTLQRAERLRAVAAIAQPASFRAELKQRDHEQMGFIAEQGQRAGADTVVLTDPKGEPLAGRGPSHELLAMRATGAHLGDRGSLIAVEGVVLDTLRLKVGEPGVGYLIAANRIDEARLRADLEPFGLQGALAVDGILVSTLPARVLASTHWDEAQRSLIARYHFRIASFGTARVLIAAPLTSLQRFTADFLAQVALVLGLLLLTMAAVTALVMQRITGPIEKLTASARQLGEGQLEKSSALLAGLEERSDELGTLARTLRVSARQLRRMVVSCRHLAKGITSTMELVEQSASTVAGGATAQKARLADLGEALHPLIEALGQTSQWLGDARTRAVQLSLLMGRADQARGVIAVAAQQAETALRSRTASEPASPGRAASTSEAMAELRTIIEMVREQRETYQKVREHLDALRRFLDDAQSSQVLEQHHGEHAERATADVRSLAETHVKQAGALHGSAEGLRSEIEQLEQLLERLGSRPPDPGKSRSLPELRPTSSPHERGGT
jgi:hypothetical protein